MRILIYGFKPYSIYKTNITERIVSAVTNSAFVSKQIFDVRFDAGMFRQTLALTRPNVILGLGQHPRARKLRIERKAKNLKITGDGPIVPIDKAGPSVRMATLRLPSTGLTTVTYDAGTYVCNYSMYLMSEYCEKNAARFGFIHVPQNIQVDAANRYLNMVIDRIATGN